MPLGNPTHIGLSLPSMACTPLLSSAEGGEIWKVLALAVVGSVVQRFWITTCHSSEARSLQSAADTSWSSVWLLVFAWLQSLVCIARPLHFSGLGAAAQPCTTQSVNLISAHLLTLCLLLHILSCCGILPTPCACCSLLAAAHHPVQGGTIAWCTPCAHPVHYFVGSIPIVAPPLPYSRETPRAD